MSRREIQKIDGDRIKIDLDYQVRQILLDLKEMAFSHLLAESPATKRLFPNPYQNSPEMEMDFQKLTREPLRGHHNETLEIFEKTVLKDEITLDEAVAWIGALNNIRLILGAALDISQDQEVPDENDPNYEGYLIYDLLTYLQGTLIEELG